MTAYKKGWLRASIAGGITSFFDAPSLLVGATSSSKQIYLSYGANCRHHTSNCSHLRR